MQESIQNNNYNNNNKEGGRINIHMQPTEIQHC